MKNIEKLIESYIESATYINDNYMDRNVRIHNRHANNLTKTSNCLAKINKIDALYPLLNHPLPYVRIITAYFLLPTFEDDAKVVYQEIIQKEIPLMSSTARISLQQWEENKNSKTKEPETG